MLSAENSLLLIIDVQNRLVGALNKNIVVKKTEIVANAAKILNIPLIITEQYPKGLGTTVLEVKNALPPDTLFVEKTYFNALLEDGMLDKIKSYNKNQIIISGIETHICVYQTACALKEEGFDVYILKDACASRNKYEFKQGIEAMAQNGIKISCTEMVIFEWLKGAKHPMFKEVQALIKQA